MFDRTEKSKFREAKMTPKAAEILDGDEYVFIYAHKWLDPDSLNWRIIGAPRLNEFSASGTMICNYIKYISSYERVF